MRRQGKVNLSVGQIRSYCWEYFCSEKSRQYFFDRCIIFMTEVFSENTSQFGEEGNGGYFLVGLEEGTLFWNSHMYRARGTYRDRKMWVQFLLWLSPGYKFELIACHTNALTSRCVSLGALDNLGKLDFNGLLLGHLVGIGETWPTSYRGVCCHARYVGVRPCCRGDDPL